MAKLTAAEREQKVTERSMALLSSKLRVQDFRDFRDVLGFDIGEVPNTVADKFSAAAGVLWLLRRQKDPGALLDDALRLTMAEIDEATKQVMPEIAQLEADLEDDDGEGGEGDDADPLPAPPVPPSINGETGAELTPTRAAAERSSILTSA